VLRGDDPFNELDMVDDGHTGAQKRSASQAEGEVIRA
jgi:hypothetical protein